MKHKIEIKPMSINEAFYGQLHETREYKKYKEDLAFLLPKNFVVPAAPFEIYYKFGFSSKASDFDNCLKCITDCIAKKYKFNDKLIKRAVIDVDYVKKGQEYFEFSLTTLLY